MKFHGLIALALSSFLFSAHAENWPQWRGPSFNGSTTEKNLPRSWSKTENVLWSTPLPGYGHATPAIWGDAVFVTSPDAEKNLLLICLDRRDGKVRWQKTVAIGDKVIGRNNMASPSPVTDGKTVFVMFGTGDLAAFDFSGKQIWARNLGKDFGRFSIMWLYGCSPMLYQNKLYVQVLQREPIPPDYTHAIDDKPHRDSYLLCIDPKTGKDLWRHIRPTTADKESNESYATPIPCEGKKGAEILVVGGNCITAHNAKTGAELWRCGGLNAKNGPWMRTVPSPVVAGEMVFACAPKKEPVFAIRDGGTGDVTATRVAWQFDEHPSDCVTPLIYQKKLFVFDGDRQVMTCLDPQTGKKFWDVNVGVRETFRASPTGADGKIYCFSENSTAVVLNAADGKVLSTIKMGEGPTHSTIAVSQGCLFVRTAQNLYCIGKK